MNLSDSPGKLVLPFCYSGGKNVIPTASQIGITNGAASLTDGFPPLTRTNIAAGGVPPSGLDANGILFDVSAVTRWNNAGAGYIYDATFAADSNVNGYPKSARVARTDGTGYWLNTIDGNAVDPESTSVGAAATAGWVPDTTNGITSITMTNSNVTLTPAQYGKKVIVITGLLTGSLNLIFPAIQGNWYVINNTTGAFTITCKTNAGTGFVVSTLGELIGDGTNIYNANKDSALLNTANTFTQIQTAVTPTVLDNSTKLQTTAGANAIGPVVGAMRNLKMSIAAASATATMTADEVIVETALGGAPIRLSSFSKTINLGITGAGGMDTGAAPASGYVSVYAIYNPTTLTSALLACNVTTSSGSIYSGANMPAGYTASALVSCWGMNGASLFLAGQQKDRTITLATNQVLSTTTTQASATSLSISNAVPPIATTVSGLISVTFGASATTVTVSVGSDANMTGIQSYRGTGTSTGSISPYVGLPIGASQTIYYIFANTAGTSTAAITVSAYTF